MGNILLRLPLNRRCGTCYKTGFFERNSVNRPPLSSRSIEYFNAVVAIIKTLEKLSGYKRR
jgi:hypothetical protein